MSTIQIRGQASLKGEIEVQGSKNAVLPMMAAAILHRGTTVLTNVPRIQDVFCMVDILKTLGCHVWFVGHELKIDASSLNSTEIPKESVQRMRSSIMVLGALLGREGQALTYYPGGCSIGSRPIDLHLQALSSLGAEIREEGGCIEARAAKLTGCHIDFPFPSVGATENAILAAMAAEGETVVEGCAREPEIFELCQFLVGMGAEILGAGTGKLVIRGSRQLHDSCYRVGGDRIVAGTYLAAAMGTGGQVTVTNVHSLHLTAALEALSGMGARLSMDMDSVTLYSDRTPKPLPVIRTGPYPDFPTDLQSPFMALMAGCSGESVIEENIFEARFETAKELEKMGALIKTKDREARIVGNGSLHGAQVRAMDLRGGAALVIAGLMADGVTVIDGCCHIMRGYEDICRDLRQVGADIRLQP